MSDICPNPCWPLGPIRCAHKALATSHSVLSTGISSLVHALTHLWHWRSADLSKDQHILASAASPFCSTSMSPTLAIFLTGWRLAARMTSFALSLSLSLSRLLSPCVLPTIPVPLLSTVSAPNLFQRRQTVDTACILSMRQRPLSWLCSRPFKDTQSSDCPVLVFGILSGEHIFTHCHHLRLPVNCV